MNQDGAINLLDFATFSLIFHVIDDSSREDSTMIPMNVSASIPGDLDGNGVVNLVDFATFSTCFGLPAPTETCDLNEFAGSDLDGNGIVDLVDFATFALFFGT